jgi:penicillin-binding protein 1A
MLRTLFGLLVLLGLLAAGIFLVPLAREPPSARPVKTELVELTRLRGGEWITLDQVPRELQEAIIATEDSRFYDHRGLDIWGSIRAVLANVRAGRPVQGGSTISQQLAKIYLEREDRTLERKLVVIGMALKLEWAYGKRDLLEMYVNSVYFGPYAYGVGRAARVYFHKPVSDLNLAESTVLAGLPQAPSIYDPINRLDRVKARQSVVIAAMTRAGYLTDDEANAVRRARTRLDP